MTRDSTQTTKSSGLARIGALDAKSSLEYAKAQGEGTDGGKTLGSGGSSTNEPIPRT